MDRDKSYWTQKASRGVSVFVLVGCVIITCALVYIAMQANALGDELTPKSFQTAGM